MTVPNVLWRGMGARRGSARAATVSPQKRCFMIKFRSPDINDIPALARVFSAYRGEICDMTPANVVMWRSYYGTELAFEKTADGGEALYLRYAVDPDIDPDSFPDARARAYAHSYAYACPKVFYPGDDKTADRIAHADEVRAAVERLVAEGAHFFCCLSWDERALILTVCPEAEVWQDRDWNDYIYDAEKMISLGGKHLAGQRNHINKFRSLYPEWRTEAICEENIPVARAFLDAYYAGLRAEGKTDAVFDAERGAIDEVLSNWRAYGQEGILLYAGDRIAAFTFGEVVAGMLDIHIEKADRAFQGAYPMVFREFAARFAGRAVTVNREEDCGEPGLRQSKLAYHPVRLAEKYNMVL